MPNNAAAKKRMRQEQKRRLHNRSIKSLVKTQITKARQAIAVDADAEAAVRAAVSELDRAAKKRCNSSKQRCSPQIAPDEAAQRKIGSRVEGSASTLVSWAEHNAHRRCRRWLTNKS